MEYIVNSEYRPFSYRDFLSFEVDGEEFHIAYGTFRNKISKFKKEGIVELDYNSSIAFYTLKGHKFGKSAITPIHTMVVNGNQSNNNFVKFLMEIPLRQQSIHDIRIKFTQKNIWNLFSKFSGYISNYNSKDIAIPEYSIDNVIVKIVIHKTDTISIILGCSNYPIPLDIKGILYFSTILTRIEERLDRFVHVFDKYMKIPSYLDWIVMMWHFGRDSLIEYSGEKFHMMFKDANDCLIRAYVKFINKKKKNIIRLEEQEYPNMTIRNIINQRIKGD